MTSRARTAEKGMISIGLGVGVAAALRPDLLQRVFGIPEPEITRASALGYRLFATRNLYLGVRGLRGDPAAIAAFGPLQVLDQAVIWHLFATRGVPRPTALAAAATSAAIIVLDLLRRRGERRDVSGPSPAPIRSERGRSSRRPQHRPAREPELA